MLNVRNLTWVYILTRSRLLLLCLDIVCSLTGRKVQTEQQRNCWKLWHFVIPQHSLHDISLCYFPVYYAVPRVTIVNFVSRLEYKRHLVMRGFILHETSLTWRSISSAPSLDGYFLHNGNANRSEDRGWFNSNTNKVLREKTSTVTISACSSQFCSNSRLALGRSWLRWEGVQTTFLVSAWPTQEEVREKFK